MNIGAADGERAVCSIFTQCKLFNLLSQSLIFSLIFWCDFGCSRHAWSVSRQIMQCVAGISMTCYWVRALLACQILVDFSVVSCIIDGSHAIRILGTYIDHLPPHFSWPNPQRCPKPELLVDGHMKELFICWEHLWLENSSHASMSTSF